MPQTTQTRALMGGTALITTLATMQIVRGLGFTYYGIGRP